MKKKIDVQKYKEMYRTFVEKKQTIILSFIDENGVPFSSVTPFIEQNGKLYVYISQVAEHYHLMEINKKIDALVIADEVDSNNRFATERARWVCTPKNIGNKGHEEVFEAFNHHFGEKMMTMLRSLDFSLFELTPETGRYVVGFGLAFNTNIDASKFEHVVVDKNNKASTKS